MRAHFQWNYYKEANGILICEILLRIKVLVLKANKNETKEKKKNEENPNWKLHGYGCLCLFCSFISFLSFFEINSKESVSKRKLPLETAIAHLEFPKPKINNYSFSFGSKDMRKFKWNVQDKAKPNTKHENWLKLKNNILIRMRFR